MSLAKKPTPSTPPLTDAEIDSVLREMDKLAVPAELVAQREHLRQPYREPVAIVCEAGDWPGDVIRFTAVCHDLSDGGLGVLSPEPLKPGTLAVFTLVTARGDELPIAATLAFCDKVCDHVYKCGAKFDTPINSALLIATDRAA